MLGRAANDVLVSCQRLVGDPGSSAERDIPLAPPGTDRSTIFGQRKSAGNGELKSDIQSRPVLARFGGSAIAGQRGGPGFGTYLCGDIADQAQQNGSITDADAGVDTEGEL